MTQHRIKITDSRTRRIHPPPPPGFSTERPSPFQNDEENIESVVPKERKFVELEERERVNHNAEVTLECRSTEELDARSWYGRSVRVR